MCRFFNFIYWDTQTGFFLVWSFLGGQNINLQKTKDDTKKCIIQNIFIIFNYNNLIFFLLLTYSYYVYDVY